MANIRFHVGAPRSLRWGHGLGLRIPLALARKVGLEAGTQVGHPASGATHHPRTLPAAPTLELLLAGVTAGQDPRRSRVAPATGRP